MKEINSDLIFVMDLDCNYHAIPEDHPNYKKISNENKSTLLANLSQMDIITVACDGLMDYYEDLMGKHYIDSRAYLEYLPNLISRFGFEEVTAIKKNFSGKLRIGIIGNSGYAEDILSIKDVLKELNTQYKDKVELILFGWNGILPDGTNALDGIPFTYVKSVSFYEYYTTLNELMLDIVLMPLRDIPFNTEGKSFVKYSEVAAFSIPVIASNLQPYTEIIEDQDTGFLVETTEDWLAAIDNLVNEETYRLEVGKIALKSVWSNLAYNNTTIQILKNVFE